MWRVSCKASPLPGTQYANEYGGASVIGLIRDNQQADAERITKDTMRESGFAVTDVEECIQVSRGSVNPELLPYFDRAEKDGQAYMVITWPKGSQPQEARKEDVAAPTEPAYSGSKTCGQCGRKVHVLAHACPLCGGQVTLVASIPQDELPGILNKQSEARGLVDQSMLLMQQGRFAEAERILRRAQEINPYNACAFGNMGGVFFLQGKFAEAIPWLEKALALDPTLEGIPGHLATAKQNAKVAGAGKKWWQFWK